MAPSLSNISDRDYLVCTAKQKREIHRGLSGILPSEFSLASPNLIPEGLPVIHHETGLVFRLIFGGDFNMGLTVHEEEAARNIADPFPATLSEMRPVKKVSIAPFAISENPVTVEYARNFFNYKGEAANQHPALLSVQQIEKHAKRLKLRLPTEAEWEYACRALTETIFWFGEGLPEENYFEGLFDWSIIDGSPLANPFGLSALFFGEWCSDYFRYSYDPAAKIDKRSRTIRGGGAFFWPWQDEEWVWCMSAMRMPSSDMLDGNRGAAAFRMAFSISLQ